MDIYLSPSFEKKYIKLPQSIKEKTKKKEIAFRDHPFNPSLKTHRLHGKEKEAWAFSIDYAYRIKFIFLAENKVLFLDIGTHEIYK